MSAFYVGQRVRLVRPRDPQFKGRTGRLLSLFQAIANVGYPTNCAVAWDHPMPIWVHPTNTHTSRLEPATPSHEAGDWSVIDKLLPNLRETETSAQLHGITAWDSETALAYESCVLSERRL